MNRECSPKEIAVYQAVIDLFWEGADLNKLTVSRITEKAGIGKGTAYEYFSDKEEMIAKALLYRMREFKKHLFEYLKEEKDFYHKMEKILLKMEEKNAETTCIFRLIHVVIDNTAINKKLQELLRKEREEGRAESGIDVIVKELILEEYKGKKQIAEEKLYYLVNSTISRIFCYGMILNSPCKQGEFTPGLMREMVCNSICREVAEI